MFAFADLPVKFVGLLLLFAWCTAWSSYELTRRQDSKQRISNVLHLVMAVVMLLMVAPMTWMALIKIVPIFALVGVFALATAWFVWLAIDALRAADRKGGLHFFGHATMFLAMTWHLVAMGMKRAAMAQGPGMMLDGGTRMILAAVGVPLMAYLLVSSIRSVWLALQPAQPVAEGDCGPDCTCEADEVANAREPELVAAGGGTAVKQAVAPAVTTHSCHEVRPVGSTKYRLEALSAFAMNFGMFWMSTGLMVPLMPFFSIFSI